jgi:integrase
MAATVKYRKDRGMWLVGCRQFNTRWYKAVADEPTARLLAKAINTGIRNGEDMRPMSKRGGPTSKATSADTVRAFGDRWLLDGWVARKMSTNNAYERITRVYIYPVLGDVPLAKLTRQRCVEFCRGLLSTKSEATGKLIAGKTRKAIHLTLSALLGAALDADLIVANPASRLDKHLVSPDEYTTEVAVWTPTEADRFLETVRLRRPPYYAFFFVALRTGLRLGELLELQWDLDFKTPHAIHVQRAFATNRRTTLTIAADGTRTREAVAGASRISSPKSKRSRVVDTTADVERVLADHRAAQREDAFRRGLPAPTLVFASLHGNRLSGNNLRTRVLGPLMKAARVPPIDIHGCRHTFASMLLARGERLDYVSRQMGHANQSTTEAKYRHFIPDNPAEAAARRARLDDHWRVGEGEGDGVVPETFTKKKKAGPWTVFATRVKG